MGMEEFLFYLLIGFFAQLVDGALGMAYGLVSTTSLLSFGLPPVTASAVTHAAECITTGFSAFAHHQLGNVNRTLILRLLIPGVLGALAGVLVLTNIDAATIKPFIALYLFIMGCIVLSKVFTVFPPPTVLHHLIPLGLIGGFMDAVGGGGWGSIVTSTLLARGHDPRTTIGSVNVCEVVITAAASILFFLSNVVINWQVVVALAIGGALASPLGALLCKHIPVKILLALVGLLVIGLSCRVLWLSL